MEEKGVKIVQLPALIYLGKIILKVRNKDNIDSNLMS
jgi:hypothetical protein